MLLELFDWLELSFIGQAIRNSLWLFPAIEAVHLLALALLGGAVFAVDFRLLGIGITGVSPAVLAQRARPYLLAAIVGLLGTGIPLFLSEAIKCYYNTSFWVKMGGLVIILIFTFTVRARFLRAQTNVAAVPTTQSKLVAVVSMGLWFLVAAAGRWIGFS